MSLLGKVFFDKQFSDIKIQCEGQSFDCHMAILAARSPVFMAMFQSDMKEKETLTVNIQDLKAGVVGGRDAQLHLHRKCFQP